MDPYRHSPANPRYICIVCWKSLSQYAGGCRTCGVDRLDLRDPLVREQVRLEAEKRLQSRMMREYSVVALTSAAVIAPLMYVMNSLAFALVPPVTMVVARAYGKMRKNSAIATYAARRRRFSAELGVDVQVDDNDYRMGESAFAPKIKDAHVENGADVDPAQLELEPLLAWLGCKLDDPPPREE
jgi:hypothetical protein